MGKLDDAFDDLHRIREERSLCAAEQVLYDFFGKDAFRHLIGEVPQQSKDHRDAVRALQQRMAEEYLRLAKD